MKLTISQRYNKITEQLTIHDAKRKVLEGKLLALKTECHHPNLKHIDEGVYGSHAECPDCGFYRPW